jgi:TonB family protein
MEHGTHGFFVERSRCARRVISIAVVLSLLGIAFLSYLPLMTSSTATEQLLRDTPILRFGYEGTEQYVRRIELKAAPGIVSDEEGLQAVYLPAARQGGATRARRTQNRSAPPVSRPPRPIEGEGDIDRAARALAARENVPLVQSQDLVIEHLVRPDYPEEARAKELEGKVAVLALVDTLGAIARVQVMGSDPAGLLEQAAVEAVWKCKFKPYREEGEAQSVYAMFRFSFRIY